MEFVHPEDIINASNLLPQDKEYVHYLGSLTTPPCSENVSWFVLDKALEASKDQMQNFSSYIEHNARPAQKLNYRFIVKAK
ncbi:MAG: carbonic anhydrase family protein [Nitrospinaceae bacterium]|nr:carbonic anhydrase family protein [Nitrospinaceae bacterium]